jgi:hypothetical protein|tara:strand:+ start:140 stop:328 length:189 start_codon:yes stop_codon:yes gene_type:complete
MPGGNKMERKNKLINAKKLKMIFKDVFDIFERHNLTSGEIEFVINDLQKLSTLYGKELMKKV